MRTIFDLILSNWFIVVIAYIVLSGIMKKLRTGGKGGRGVPQPQGRAPRGGMPTFGGDGSGWPGSANPMPKAKPVQARPTDSGGARPQLVDMGGRRSQAAPPPPPEENAAAISAPKQSTAAGAALSSGEPPGSGESAAAAFGSLTAQDAARGVLWAEILGPPRAKRPFRR